MKKLAFLFELMVLCSLLPLHMSAEHVTLDADPKILKMITRSFTLNCTYQSTENHKIVSLQLLKKTKKGAKAPKELASLTDESGIHVLRRSTYSSYVKYSGTIIGKNKAYLCGRWTIVLSSLRGIYTCRVKVMNNRGHIRSIESSVGVTVPKFSRQNIIEAIRELQGFHETLNRTISLELTKMHASQELLRRAISVGKFMESKCCATASQSGISRHYKAFTSKSKLRTTHSQAAAFCWSQGGYLVEIDYPTEWKLLARWVKNEAEYGYYIAGRRNKNSDKFYWARSGREIPKSMKWGPNGSRYHRNRDNCLELGKRIQWKVRPIFCWARRSFICEILDK